MSAAPREKRKVKPMGVPVWVKGKEDGSVDATMTTVSRTMLNSRRAESALTNDAFSTYLNAAHITPPRQN
jgi:hypothetical protein